MGRPIGSRNRARVDGAPLVEAYANFLTGGTTMGRANVQTTRAERRTAAAQRMAKNLRTISDRDVELLELLADRRKGHGARDAWMKPRELGATTHSHHANTLVKLERHGLVERKHRVHDVGRPGAPPVLVSRITARGQKLLAAVRRAR